jgi:hypothetical protein
MAEPFAGMPTRRSFAQRLIGAIKLDAGIYEEIEHDPTAMGQAVAVVVLAALATGIGGMRSPGAPGLVADVIGGLLGWLTSTAVIWLIGVRFMKCTSDYAELLRTLGFASAPRLITVIGSIPIIGVLALFAGGIAGLVAYVIAVRQALDVTTGRAILVCVLAYLVGIAVVVLLIMLVASGAPSGPTA